MLFRLWIKYLCGLVISLRGEFRGCHGEALDV